MKTFQISEDIKNVSRVGLGCMRLTEKRQIRRSVRSWTLPWKTASIF
ncbi:MAG: hypothetical protein ACLR6B_19625 [Blautia sp.]